MTDLCAHDVVDRKTAAVDGSCPLCQAATIVKLEEQVKEINFLLTGARIQSVILKKQADAVATPITRLRELVAEMRREYGLPGWRGTLSYMYDLEKVLAGLPPAVGPAPPR